MKAIISKPSFSSCKVIKAPKSSSLAARRGFASQSGSNKIYEFRTYDIKTDHFPDFISLTNQHIDKRLKYSKLIGYWTSELSETINQTVHIWEYDDLDHRASVRKTLVGDHDWMQLYMARMRPMVAKQQAVVFKQFEWYPFKAPQSTANNIYELVISRAIPGQVSNWEDKYKAGMQNFEKYHSPFGVWYSHIGELNCMAQLWAWPSFGARSEALDKFNKDAGCSVTNKECAVHLNHVSSKILIPTAFSPLK
mmetsp:Transcript_12749/g.17598  ORF Transcript_12749/g.17598 Transcript_12749/m.17598 type:complete len:251 (-) Transcript_12749:24-776(-)